MKNNIKKTLFLGLMLFTLTGCTKILKNSDNKSVTNPKTGQSLTENILCRPTDEETIKLYLENGVDLEKLPYCVCEEEYVTDESKYKLPEKEETVENTENTEEKVEVTAGDKAQEKPADKPAADKKTGKTADEAVEKTVKDVKPAPAATDGVKYGIQVLAGKAKLTSKDKALKGYTPYIVDTGSLYKYIVCVSESVEEARAALAAVKEIFPDAFLVKIEGNSTKRVK